MKNCEECGQDCEVKEVREPFDGEEVSTLVRLWGDIDENTSERLAVEFHVLKNINRQQPFQDPIHMMISTFGGNTMDCLAIYDTLCAARKELKIETYGVGKVMSAGTLILAAGTKGMRKVTKNCRIMIHAVSGGHEGHLWNMKKEMQEMEWIQERYIAGLSKETGRSKNKIRSMLEPGNNVYMTAEEAVAFGIADEIV